LVRRVLTFPNPVLKQRCDPVDLAFGVALAEDLVETMRAHPGCVGIAAPQVGEPVRVAVIDVRGHRHKTSSNGLLVLVNPAILAMAGIHVAREGCLSLPEITADVARAERIVLCADDGRQIWSDAFEARVIQHEIDHLDGILILDRVASAHGVHARQRPPARPRERSA
jgi:peptide deformylase